MMLLTKAIRQRLPRAYGTDGDLDVRVAVKFFTPYSNWAWYAFEGEPVLDDDGNEIDFLFYGLVDGFYPELGSFALSELKSTRGLAIIERDMHYRPETKRELFARLIPQVLDSMLAETRSKEQNL